MRDRRNIEELKAAVAEAKARILSAKNSGAVRIWASRLSAAHRAIESGNHS